MRTRAASFAALCLLTAGAVASATPQHATAASTTPPIKHVVVIVLENSDFANNFGAGKAMAPYLNNTLVPAGVEIPLYYGTGHASLDNYVAMISGQPPNPATQGDCTDTSTLTPGTIQSDGAAVGTGCTFPANVPTIADQLNAAGDSWKGYMEDMGNSPSSARDTCRGPGAPVNPNAHAVPAGTTDKYATKHNPFVYFASITGMTHTDGKPSGTAVAYDKLAYCDAHDVQLNQLSTDLAKPGGLPNFSFITPNLCNDGHDVCGGSSNPDNGLAQADAFLANWVPKILANPAFQPGGDGLLVVNWDEGEGDSTSCCNEQPGPNLNATGVPPTTPGDNEPPGSGGGQTGAVAVGPFIAPNSPASTVSYNHYSLLRSIEDIFGLDHIGYAAASGLTPFGSDVYTNATPPANTPEAPAVALLILPAAAIAVLGVRRRRTHTPDATTQG